MSRPHFVDAVLDAIKKRGMIQPGQTVVVAVSGGPDSTAMLHALWSIRSELDIGLVAATMDHGIRGAESRSDVEYVSDLCRQLNVLCRTEHRDIPAITKKRRVSTSVAARDERHSFLRQVAGECCVSGSERIALGHTSDDRAETILMNILRGAGTDGLCAMPPVQLPIIRPILSCTRAQANAYCVEECLSPRTDSSNTDMHYRRNRIRTELLPQLAAYYNSGIRDALIRLAEISQDDIAVVDHHAADLLRDATIDVNSMGIVLSTEVLRAAPVALQRRAIRSAIETVRGELTDVDFESIESVLAAIAGSLTNEQTLPRIAGRDFHIRVKRESVRIWTESPAARIDRWQVLLTVPGEVHLPFEHRIVSAEVVRAHQAAETNAIPSSQNIDREDFCCCFRRRDLADVLTIRSWRIGDRFHPKGLSGTKKLQDMYTDCKVPRSERNLVPVVEGKGGLIVAALGVRTSELSLNKSELREIAAREPDEHIAVLRLSRAV